MSQNCHPSLILKRQGFGLKRGKGARVRVRLKVRVRVRVRVRVYLFGTIYKFVLCYLEVTFGFISHDFTLPFGIMKVKGLGLGLG